MSPFVKEILENPEIEDIVLSPHGISYFSKGHWLGPREDLICSEKNLFILSRRIADKANITLGLTQPSADSFIDFNGENLFRAHVVVSPMALNGTEITLRRVPKAKQFYLEDFSLSEDKILLLKKAMKDKKSILIAGATGAGKSSFISALMNEISGQDRVLLLEDSPELPIPNTLSTKLLARFDKFGFRDGASWDLSHLVHESLRMRPDRIIIGECRGPEATAISHALMTGHKGVMTTLHAGSCEEALERFDRLVQGAQAQQSFYSRDHWDLVLHIFLNSKNVRTLSGVFVKK